MALSEREQELLAQLEKQLNNDPAFASTMTGPQPLVAPAVTSSPRNLVIGALVAVVGLGVIIAGVSTKIILLGVLGFVLAAAGVYFATTAPKGAKAAGGGASARPAPSKAKGSSRFMQNLENKWDERQGGSRF
ncbi:DUF3040 domain-containing protein [Rothia sp. SD9660Na]|uniref:DUF3040 domain-containing protein n=1 Tax=Rothia sp. SD9660Na TaxID=3047030 RepID=UPI0024BB4D60|nr:DUF3040 domain-containing protein [Rothia sp. SD9660Na]WHS49783.1 DUF3040 domain-containing protein [Rothia sp. SD9660Na]